MGTLLTGVWRISVLSVYALIFFPLLGCSSSDPDSGPKTIEVSISSDGKRIAVLYNAGEKQSRVQIMYLDRSDKWIDLPTPPRTTSIRFGLLGHQLLLTHLDQEAYFSELSTIDLGVMSADPIPRKILFKGDVLAYPIEVEEGRILVRHCKFTRVVCPWNLIRDGKLEREVVSSDRVQYSLQYGQPVVVRGKGFYWLTYKQENTPEFGPDVLAFSFDEGGVFQPKVPAIDHRLDSVACDYSGARCLHAFTEETSPVLFLYNTKVLFKREICSIDGVAGWSDGASLSPDGRFGVKSLAAGFDKPRHVVYFEFDPAKCEPSVVKHIPLPM